MLGLALTLTVGNPVLGTGVALGALLLNGQPITLNSQPVTKVP